MSIWIISTLQDQKDLACTACEVGAAAIIDLFLVGTSVENLEEIALGVCVLFGIQEREVCKGMVWHFAVGVVSCFIPVSQVSIFSLS